VEYHKNLRYFCNFKTTDRSKQSPFGRKFAQSGHPSKIQTGEAKLMQYKVRALSCNEQELIFSTFSTTFRGKQSKFSAIFGDKNFRRI
jgi:hypothetical protein